MRQKVELLKEFFTNSKFKPGSNIPDHFTKIEKMFSNMKRNNVFDYIPMLLFSITDSYDTLVEHLLENNEYFEKLTPEIIKSKLMDEEESHRRGWTYFDDNCDLGQQSSFKHNFQDQEGNEIFIKTEKLNDPLFECEEANILEKNDSFKNLNDFEVIQFQANEKLLKENFEDTDKESAESEDNDSGEEFTASSKSKMRGPKKNINRKSRDSKGQLKCTECGNVYLLVKNFEKHLVRDHKKPLAEISKILNHNFGIKSSTLSCPICYLTFSRQKMYDTHLKVHGNDGSLKVRCDICKFWAKDNIEIQTHYADYHKDKLICKICNKIFVNALGRHLHMKNFHQKYKMTEEFQEKIDALKKKSYNNEPLKKISVGQFICVECRIPKSIKQRTKFEQHLFKIHNKTLDEITEILKIQFQVEASNYMCKYCGLAYKTEKILDIHERSHGENGQLKFACRFCTVFFGATKDDLHSHYKIAHPTSLHCVVCNITFAKVAKAFEHKKQLHPRLHKNKTGPSLIKNSIEFPNDNKNDCDEEHNFPSRKEKLEFQCTEHDKTYVQVHIYQKHLIMEHEKSFEDVNKFLKERYNIVSDFVCRICFKRYQTYTSLMVHEKLHGEESNLTRRCLHCPKLFATKDNLRTHCQQQHLNKSFCKQCNKIIISNIKDHIRVVHGPKKINSVQYFCKKCGIEFSNKNYLINHEQSDCGKNPLHKCDQCDKAFMYAGTLVKHKLVHTGEFPFRCSYCSKGFRQKNSMLCHERTHTGEKPFKCKLCEFATNHSYNLKNHMSIHTGIKRYQCSSCNDTFSCFSGLKSHYNSRLDSCGANPDRQLRVNPNVFVGYRNGEIVFDKNIKRKTSKKQ